MVRVCPATYQSTHLVMIFNNMDRLSTSSIQFQLTRTFAHYFLSNYTAIICDKLAVQECSQPLGAKGAQVIFAEMVLAS